MTTLDLSTFGDRKADYIKLYESLGLPYRGESKDELKFNLMKYADKIPDEQLDHIKVVPVAKKATPKPMKAKVTELSDDGVFKAKVEYVEESEEEEPEQEVKAKTKTKKSKDMKPIKTVDIQQESKKPKSKATKEVGGAGVEPKTEGSVPVKLSWNQFLSLKAKEHPDMSRKDLMVKYSGKVWNDYKAQFKE